MHLFGTDGIRGIVNKDLTDELARNLGYVSSSILLGEGSKIVIGADTRQSGTWLKSAMIEGLLTKDIEVFDVGVLPTPAISFLTRELGAQMGIVISASHNPSKYNGIKFFNNQGIKLEEKYERLIEKQINSDITVNEKTRGKVSKVEGEVLYIDHLKGCIDISLKGLRVALDCANGSASYVGPKIYEELGIEVDSIYNEPDGENINLECGSTHPQNLKKEVMKTDVDAGIALDGDADRAVAMDESGFHVDGDFIMAICAKNEKEHKRLKGNKIVTTVMTNLGFYQAMEREGIDVLKTKVGDKYVLEEMIRSDAKLGGEQSGHVIFLDNGPAGDGLLTSLKLLEVVKETGKPLSELAKVMQRLPQILINVDVEDKQGLNDNRRVVSAIKEANEELEGNGRILVRPSGTEDLIRVMTEAKDIKKAKKIAADIAEIVKEEFN